jgi:hypothetical protein
MNFEHCTPGSGAIKLRLLAPAQAGIQAPLGKHFSTEIISSSDFPGHSQLEFTYNKWLST